MQPLTTDPIELQKVADRIRRNALQLIYQAGSGHPGGSLSAADLLAYLYAKELRFDPARPDWPDRDRFVLSKGHACPALYAVAAEFGFITPEQLAGFRKIGGALQGHPHLVGTPWVEASTGSLGQGFSAAIGMAMGLRYQGKDARVYVMLGDGELQEGEVWEGVMSAAHHRLDNLCAILDFNKLQSDDSNENIMGLEPLQAKWQAFNWHTVEIDGHDFDEMANAFNEARRIKEKPTVLIAHTLKGKGVSFMENSPAWHGSVKLREDETMQAFSELGDGQCEIVERL